MDDLFSAKWWRRDVAIAWVLTRDRGFTQEQHDRGPRMRALDVAYTLRGEADGRTSYDAWDDLRDAIPGHIRTTGKPAERSNDGNGNALTSTESRRSISDIELEALIVLEVGDEEWLVDKDWQVSRGSDWSNVRGFRSIEMAADDVIRLFPALMANSERTASSPEAAAQPALPLEGRGNTARAVASAIDDLFPNGVPPGITSGDRNNQIFRWLEARGIRSPNRKTIERVIAERRRK
ncbi:hypothetical protein IVB16_27455 [Bradyrhizobium sp. 183]|uniref:hypothetical protein n=1 Tax=unclassified Bradyrhizobium TaxID=2631580 RepID=UPI001FFE9E08|nr:MULTISPECIES: hypothetical protein [unclassified Bradyrhizobium]UPJ78588.1 hypothetical protein IVB17_27455 [Bradyrhizobium sp. 184]UPJ86383.1 hypothetical protein IVB16_27455 [Bradyrhizobium sp. 183]